MNTTMNLRPKAHLCATCADFGTIRLATLFAHYLPESFGGQVDLSRFEYLCDSCYNPMIYCAAQPLPPIIPN